MLFRALPDPRAHGSARLNQLKMESAEIILELGWGGECGREGEGRGWKGFEREAGQRETGEREREREGGV